MSWQPGLRGSWWGRAACAELPRAGRLDQCGTASLESHPAETGTDHGDTAWRGRNCVECMHDEVHKPAKLLLLKIPGAMCETSAAHLRPVQALSTGCASGEGPA